MLREDEGAMREPDATLPPSQPLALPLLPPRGCALLFRICCSADASSFCCCCCCCCCTGLAGWLDGAPLPATLLLAAVVPPTTSVVRQTGCMHDTRGRLDACMIVAADWMHG